MSNMDFSVSEAAVSLEWYIVESGVFVRPLTKVIIYKSHSEPFQGRHRRGVRALAS